MRYEEVSPIEREAAHDLLASKDPFVVCSVLVRLAYHDPDWAWVQARCLEFARDPRPEVRGCAALCLGHLARIHRVLDLDTVLPVLRALLDDPTGSFVAGIAEDALDDIGVFLGKRKGDEVP